MTSIKPSHRLERGLDQAIKNLDSINKKLVPAASAMAVNKVGAKAEGRAVRQAAKEVKVKAKVIRPRVSVVKRANPQRPYRVTRIRRYDIPAISIGEVRTQIRRKNGGFLVSGSARNDQGQYVKREHSGNTAIKVGKHTYKNAFVNKVSSGQWHVLHRIGESRYPLGVATVPFKDNITKAMEFHTRQLMNFDMPKEMERALAMKFRQELKRR
ncbi:phage tail protein [Aliivibrio fischeri]|uniref:phage tail protein n=1 Tax=Aliivibrio fischeri TaxID=668 RepID=UPI00080DDB00|nr:phage tail protein [Aliivibrio fischeri]OCH31833.1 phage tail protein [Aliivibrio fischeri]